MDNRRFGSTRLGQDFSQEVVEAVWTKARAIPDFDATQYRWDACGAVLERSRYGNTIPGGLGWEIDHIVPVARGGGDELDNLQPLHWENNRAKGDNGPGQWLCAMPRD